MSAWCSAAETVTNVARGFVATPVLMLIFAGCGNDVKVVDISGTSKATQGTDDLIGWNGSHWTFLENGRFIADHLPDHVSMSHTHPPRSFSGRGTWQLREHEEQL